MQNRTAKPQIADSQARLGWGKVVAGQKLRRKGSQAISRIKIDERMKYGV
jgi:hypothetical protein